MLMIEMLDQMKFIGLGNDNNRRLQIQTSHS